MQHDGHTVRPRLLFLGPTLPYPPDRGAALRGYYTLRALGRRYEIDALCFRQPDDPTQMPLDDRVRRLEAMAHLQLVPMPDESGLLRRAARLWSRVSGSPAPGTYADRRYRRRVVETVFERDPRIVHVDSIRLHEYLPMLADRTVVLVHDEPIRADAIGRGEEGGHEPGGGEQSASADLGRALARVAVTLVPFESRRDALLERVPGARVEVVPPAIDLRHFRPASGTGHGLAYVGGTRSRADRDALEYFTSDILPKLRASSGVQALEPISWIGPAREGDRAEYRRRGIDVTGYVEDIRPVVRPVACYVIPRRHEGAQTRLLQAWAMGKAVVSTSAGCGGLDAVDGRNLLIRDDPAAFARAVLDVLEDRELRRRLGEGGRKTVEAGYGWDQRGRELVEMYQRLEGTPPRVPA
ncbi:MAG: glycosyltransferase family 4 protein [Longimicrobiales bacterium]|nr:glycosyltransferase family 4 protein [Longimicrobiales bacterium]